MAISKINYYRSPHFGGYKKWRQIGRVWTLAYWYLVDFLVLYLHTATKDNLKRNITHYMQDSQRSGWYQWRKTQINVRDLFYLNKASLKLIPDLTSTTILNSRMIDLYPSASDQDTGLGDPFLIRRLRVKVVTLHTVRRVLQMEASLAWAAGDLPKEWDFRSLDHLCISPSTTVCPNPWSPQKLFGFHAYVTGRN